MAFFLVDMEMGARWTNLAIGFSADVRGIEGRRRGCDGGSAVTTGHQSAGTGHHGAAGHRGQVDRMEADSGGRSVPELDQRLEVARLGQRQDPEEFDTTASFVDVHLKRPPRINCMARSTPKAQHRKTQSNK